MNKSERFITNHPQMSQTSTHLTIPLLYQRSWLLLKCNNYKLSGKKIIHWNKTWWKCNNFTKNKNSNITNLKISTNKVKPCSNYLRIKKSLSKNKIRSLKSYWKISTKNFIMKTNSFKMMILRKAKGQMSYPHRYNNNKAETRSRR